MRILNAHTAAKKIVLLRIDCNVPLSPRGGIEDDFRIKRTLPTIQHLLSHKNKIVLLGHLGRPKGVKAKLSLAPVARRLAVLLGKQIFFVGKHPREAKTTIDLLPFRNVVMLENLRFWKGEEENADEFAKELASLGEVYVNDAFGAAHRKEASLVAITKFLPSFAGFLLQEEMQALDVIREKGRKPFVAILGGAKLADKLPLIRHLLPRADSFLLGGGVANTFLAASGARVGKSLYEKSLVGECRKLLRTKKFLLRHDYMVAKSREAYEGKVVLRSGIKRSDLILDIGPETIKEHERVIRTARTLLWNGPLGYIENSAFAKGSLAIARAIARNRRAFSVVGGGETIAVFRTANTKYQIPNTKTNIFLSTGGGAMLEYLAGKKLPAIEALEKLKIKSQNAK